MMMNIICLSVLIFCRIDLNMCKCISIKYMNIPIGHHLFSDALITIVH